MDFTCCPAFELINEREVEELHAKAVQLKHKKTGAEVLWMNNGEMNKTFSVAFKTLPDDDTGVFHILEHSVLNGSKKYPVKEPFVELLKGSMQTFLNAMTFPDKTVYPVSSKNNKDFLNLMDVYMDAVFHTNIDTKKETFLQEGWHHELADADSDLLINGVVYNEMKGAYSSVDTPLRRTMNKLLFPDTVYRFESGGHPDHIPELTYEKFLSMYRRYYHPSNARIYLDGDIDCESVFERMDSFLKEYEYLDVQADIAWQNPCEKSTVCDVYPVTEEDTTNKTQVMMGQLYADYTKPLENIGMSILIDVLAGSQEAPLRQALVKSGLTEDFELYVDDGMQQSALFMVYRNTEKENVEKLNEILHTTLEEIRKTGLNYKMIEGTLNFMEFRAKMKESFAPRGILNAITVMDTWLYGGDPLQNLKINSLYKQLREGLQNGFFEQLFERLLDDSHRQTVILTPSVTIQSQKEEQLHDTLQQLKSSWDDITVQSVMEMNRNLRAVQQREDTPEELATMPVLKLEDIDTTVEPLPLREDCIDGVTVLWSEQDTEGIIHCELMFDISDATEEDLLKLSFAPGLWGELATEHYNAYDLQAEVRSVLGAFGIGKEVNVHTHEDSYKPTFTVFFSCLEEKREQAWELVKEIIFRTKWEDTEVVHNMLRQEKYNDEQGLISSGHSYAMRRVGACLTPWYATQEYLSGYESMKWLRHVEETFDENGKDVLADWKATVLKFLTRNRLILGYIGTENKEFAGELIHSFEEKEAGSPAVIRLLDNHKEGIEIASGISYAVMGGILPESVTEQEGQLRVLSKILTLYYLWNEIRVQGGAYGTGFAGRARGFATFYSYRDPNCSNSLNVYRKAAEYIRNLDLSEEELTKTIIGTMSDLDPVISVRQKGRSAFVNWLAGFTQQDREQLRKQVLSTTLEDIHGFADALEELAAQGEICVVGGKSLLETLADEHLTIAE